MLYRQRSTFFYEMRIKPSEKISPFRKRASEPGRTQKTKYAAVSRIPSEAAVGRRVQGSVKRNVFVKPNEQSRACASYAMARKRLLKTNRFAKPSAEPNKVRTMPRREMDERNSRLFPQSVLRLPTADPSGSPVYRFFHSRETKHTCIPINNGSYIQLFYTLSDFRAAAPDRQSEPSPQSRVCRLAPFGRELRTSPASVVGL